MFCYILSYHIIIKNTSTGYDETPAHILKQSIVIYIKPLTYLVNSSIYKEFFLEHLKLAMVISFYKSGNKDSIENYGPTNSVLSEFIKVFWKSYVKAFNKLY